MRAEKLLPLAMVSACWLALTASSAEGALLAYDGFAAGGSTPTAGQYRTVQGTSYQDIALAWRSTTDTTQTGGQNPTALGFVDAWVAPNNQIGQTAQTVYFQARSQSLNYTSPDSIVMPTTNGSASVFRASSTSTINKQVYRDLNIAVAPETAYFSVLVSFDAGQPILFQTQTLGSNVKPFIGFGIDSNGAAYLSTSMAAGTSGTVQTGGMLAANTTHLLVMKVENIGTADVLSLYVNPNLASEAANTAVATITGDIYVGGNSDYPLTNLFITGTPSNGSVLFDEFRIGTTWADLVAVPEPQRMAFCLIGFGLLIMGRRRK